MKFAIFNANGAPLSYSLIARAPADTRVVLVGQSQFMAAEMLVAPLRRYPEPSSTEFKLDFPLRHIETEGIPWVRDELCAADEMRFMSRKKAAREWMRDWIETSTLLVIYNLSTAGLV